ncbi:MAG: hypothetical protein KJO21_10830 [Verrucomicrobiae bacterium]|nr:hypothetical protein [Verrucomicrobiae bacterium]NNJ42779.1 hypothetical protein [Akkermansiaceae bacterium]
MPRLVSGGVNQRRGKDSMGVVVAAAVILLVACGVVFFVSEQGKNDEPSGAGGFDQVASGPKGAEGTWLQTGWRQEATNVLNAFMSAQSPDERLKYVIPNEGVLDELKIFYPAGSDDSDTPHEFFSHVMGSKMDQKRGIFLMQYRQPAQDDVTGYFTPITSSGSSPDEEPLNVMDMAHLVDEDSLSKPIGINAFFKQTDHGMKLDASVFIQGKFRTFRAFVDYPRPGKTQVFRVVVGESLSHALRDDPDIRTYRLEDFAYPKDFINLPARVDSDVGKVLSVINWRGENRDRTIRTATVELGWSHETPSELNIVKVVCWEFLGVGGELGNAVVKSPPVPAENNTPNKKTQ